MGSGVSSLVRLRKALVIRAYNLRGADQTIEEQFDKYAFRKVRLCTSSFYFVHANTTKQTG